MIQTYRWQCMECKTCTVCQQPHHEDEMMFCDKCDRGYHTFCVGMDSIPTGEWMDTQPLNQKWTTNTTKETKANLHTQKFHDNHSFVCLLFKMFFCIFVCLFYSYSFILSVSPGLWVCEVCDKDFTTPKKKGGAKTPKKSKSAKK